MARIYDHPDRNIGICLCPSSSVLPTLAASSSPGFQPGFSASPIWSCQELNSRSSACTAHAMPPSYSPSAVLLNSLAMPARLMGVGRQTSLGGSPVPSPPCHNIDFSSPSLNYNPQDSFGEATIIEPLSINQSSIILQQHPCIFSPGAP